MNKIESGNFLKAPYQPLRDGMERVVFAMEAEHMCCAIAKVENGHEIRPHSHVNEQIAMVLEGVCDYYVNGVSYRLEAGSWVTVPGGAEHYIHVYDSPVPCMQLDVFAPDRPEYSQSYKGFLEELRSNL